MQGKPLVFLESWYTSLPSFENKHMTEEYQGAQMCTHIVRYMNVHSESTQFQNVSHPVVPPSSLLFLAVKAGGLPFFPTAIWGGQSISHVH